MDSLPQTFARAQALHQAGQLRQAEPLYRAVLEQLPAHVVAAHRLGMLLLQSHRADEAEPLLRASAGARGAPPEAAAHLGLALHPLGRYEDALHWLDRAAPGPAGARLPHWRANTLVELGRFDEARAAFDRALALAANAAERAHLEQRIREIRGGK
jgi:tetratricopeptide (TPR) repeat protein